MKPFVSKPARLALAAAVLIVSAGQVMARPDTRNYSCAQNRALVAQYGKIVMSTGQYTYDQIVANRSYCEQGEIIQRLYAPAADTPRCLVGYICTNNYYIERN